MQASAGSVREPGNVGASTERSSAGSIGLIVSPAMRETSFARSLVDNERENSAGMASDLQEPLTEGPRPSVSDRGF